MDSKHQKLDLTRTKPFHFYPFHSIFVRFHLERITALAIRVTRCA